MKNINKLGLWIILLAATLTVMAGAVIAPVLNLIREGVGADAASVGFIITIHALFIALFSPLVGVLIDKIGTKKIFIFGLLLYGLAGGAGIFISSFWALLISRAVLGIATAAIFNSITVMILNLYQGVERNKAMGWRNSANSAGGIAWPLIGGFVGVLSWHLPFAVYLISIPLGLIAIFAVPETHQIKTAKENKSRTLHWQIDKQAAEYSGKVRDKVSLLKIFKNNPILLAIFGLLFWNFTLLYTIVVFLPQKLANIGIVDPLKIGIFISILAVAAGAVSLVYAKIKSRTSYRTIMLIALAVWVISFIAISQTSSLFVIALSVFLFGIGQGIVLPAIMILIGETVELSFRGRVMSYAGTFTYLGQFASPIIFSPVLLTIGLNGIFLIAGLVCIILFILFFRLMKK